MKALEKQLTAREQIPVLQTPLASAPRESEAQFRELMAHLQQVFWMKNVADTAVLYVSPAYEKIWGYSRESLYDKSHEFLDSVHPEDRDRVGEAMKKKHDNDGYEEEYRILRPDGTQRWIWARSYSVRDEHGEIKRYAGIAEDISERKWAEQERSRLAAIIEHAEDAIVSTTLEGVIIAWNRGAERKYGYLAEEIIGHSIFALIPPDRCQEYLDIMKKVRKGEPVAAYDTVRTAKDGSLINLSVGISPIEARDGKIVGISKVAHDISRVRKLEAQLVESQKMEVIGQFTGGVAHDFNNILAIILGYSELMLEERDLPELLRKSATAMRHAAERGAALTRQLLVFSRKEAVQSVVLELKDVLQGMEGLLRQLIHENVELSFIHGNALGRIKADPGYIGQLMMNLVVNARDAMPEGGKLCVGTSNVTFEAGAACNGAPIVPGEYVMLSVTDTGGGMSDEVKARAFEPFFTTKPKHKGTGLGLATCQVIIEQLGGHIGLESKVGTGTTFRIYFPRVPEMAEFSARAVQAGPMPLGTEKLLVIEGDPEVRQLLCAVLRGQGYQVICAVNGQDGLRAVLERDSPGIRLVISDVIVPQMKETIRESPGSGLPELRYLFTSGHKDDILAAQGMLEPGVAFLPKPYSIAALAHKVRELLDTPAGAAAGPSP